MRFTKYLFIFFYLPALVAQAASASARDIRIVSMEIGEGLQTSESPGLYGELIYRILENADVEYDFQVYPLKRALRTFFRDEADCVWALDSGMLRQFDKQHEPLLDSEALFTSTHHVFMVPGAGAIASLGDLAGKKVGLHYYSNMNEELEQVSADLVPVGDNNAKVRLLVNNRVDAILAWMPDVLVAFRTVGAGPAWINPVLKIEEANVGIVCHDSDITRPFLAKVNPVIRNFARSSAYRNIFDKYGANLPSMLGE